MPELFWSGVLGTRCFAIAKAFDCGTGFPASTRLELGEHAINHGRGRRFTAVKT